MDIKKRVFLIGSIALLSAAMSSATVLYVNPGSNSGNTSYTGNLGLDFTTSQTSQVTSLGIFNDDGDGIVDGGPITVGLYDSTHTLLASQTFTHAHGQYTPEAQGFYIFQFLTTPLDLAPGTYTVVVVGFSTSDHSGDGSITPFHSSQPNPALTSFITYGGSRSDTNTTLDFPTASTFADQRFVAGTVEIHSTATTPEPGTFSMLGLGGALLVFGLRRRARQTA